MGRDDFSTLVQKVLLYFEGSLREAPGAPEALIKILKNTHWRHKCFRRNPFAQGGQALLKDYLNEDRALQRIFQFICFLEAVIMACIISMMVLFFCFFKKPRRDFLVFFGFDLFLCWNILF